jgi:hypothetical protein
MVAEPGNDRLADGLVADGELPLSDRERRALDELLLACVRSFTRRLPLDLELVAVDVEIRRRDWAATAARGAAGNECDAEPRHQGARIPDPRDAA